MPNVIIDNNIPFAPSFTPGDVFNFIHFDSNDIVYHKSSDGSIIDLTNKTTRVAEDETIEFYADVSVSSDITMDIGILTINPISCTNDTIHFNDYTHNDAGSSVSSMSGYTSFIKLNNNAWSGNRIRVGNSDFSEGSHTWTVSTYLTAITKLTSTTWRFTFACKNNSDNQYMTEIDIEPLLLLPFAC